MMNSEDGKHCLAKRNDNSDRRLVPQTPEEWESHRNLKRAIRNGHTAEAKCLIQEGVPVNVTRQYAYEYRLVTPLHLAVQVGCLDLIRDLLDRGADVNSYDIFRETPLTMSARLRKYTITDLLLNAGNLVNWKCWDTNLSHLQIACMRNNIAAVGKLIRLGSEINEQVGQKALHFAGYTALHFAVENHATEIVQLLVDNGASIVETNAHSMTPLHLAHEVRDEGIIDILLSAHMHEPGNPKDGRGISHFHIACTRNHLNFVKFFLQQRIDVNSPIVSDRKDLSFLKMWSDYEPLRLAILYECPDVVELLLSHGADIRSYSTEDDVYLELAYDIGNERIINLLLSHKLNKKRGLSKPNALSGIQLASLRNNVKVVGEIISGARRSLAPKLNFPLSNGCTLLHLLVKYLPAKVLETIREMGGDMSIKDARGKTPLHILFDNRSNWMDKSITLTLADFEKNPVDDFGLSHFHIACTKNEVDLIGKFLEQGANVNAPVSENSLKWPGYTPLHFAVKFKQLKIVDALLKHGAKMSSKDGNGLTPFDQAIVELNKDISYDHEAKKFYVIQRMLLELQERGQKSSDKFDDRGFSLLHIFCQTHDKSDMAQFLRYADLLPGGIDQTINYPSSKYHLNTPLHLAMDNGNVNIVNWLVERGADIHLKNGRGIPPFQTEINSGGNYGILKKNPELLRVPENPVDTRGYSYFHLSCMYHDRATMKYYLQSGVDINSTRKTNISGNYFVETPLQSVLRCYYYCDSVLAQASLEETVKFLLDNGADVMARDAYMNTPLHCMERYFDEDVLQLLIDRGADVNAENVFGETPLFRACRDLDTTKKIKLLLKLGADINMENDRGNTPFTDACELLMNTGDTHDKVILTLVKHVKKLMVASIYVSDKNRKMYIEFFDSYTITKYNEPAYEEECEKEIERMKDVRINKYTTLHSIFFKTPNEMAYLSQNGLLSQIITSDSFDSDFPEYGYFIKLQYKRGLSRRPILQKCKLLLCSLTKFSAEYAERILDYLDDDDLENIIKSGKIVSHELGAA